MRALFDVNVLIALFQPDHVHHQRAHHWWEKNQSGGWATCPITENGFVRILSQPKYPMPQTVPAAIRLLNMAKTATDHAFWPDSLSLLDARHFNAEAFTQHGQITDAYLLALAAANHGRLVTLDPGIKEETVRGAGKGQLLVI
jgi:toxin-antitoxin system PIN domain toxin